MSAAIAAYHALDYPCQGIVAAGNVIFYMIVALETPWYSLKRFWQMIRTDSSMFVETCVAAFCALPGCWMFLNPHPPRRHWDDLLEAVMPLWVYGVVLVGIALLIIYSLHFESTVGRRIGQGLAALIWLFFLFFFSAMFPYYLVVPLLPPIVFMAGWSWWRLGRANDGARRAYRAGA